MISAAGGSRCELTSGLRVLLVGAALLGVALLSGRAAGGAAASSPAHIREYGSECTHTCLFRIGIAYCEYDGQVPGPGRDNTVLACYNMGRPERILTYQGWRIVHRGWAWMSTQDSNKVTLHASGIFEHLPGRTPPSRYQPVPSFHYGDYACRRYGDGARCTIPSERYPGTLLAIYLTKRGGVWYRRIPGTGPQPTLVHLNDFNSPDRKIWCEILKDPSGNYAWCGTQAPSRLATVKADGSVTVCNGDCLQNWSTTATVLAYGHRSELNGFRCASEKNGITCTVIAGAGKGKGFLINASGITEVG